jgi:hypothetical protein
MTLYSLIGGLVEAKREPICEVPADLGRALKVEWRVKPIKQV